MDKKSSIFNLNANIIILIAYLGGLIFKWLNTACYFAWAIPLIIYLIETKNEFVKKQSFQAMCLFLISSILSLLIYILLLILSPINTENIYEMIITGRLFLVDIISIISTIIAILITIVAIITIIKTYNYENYDIPYLSKYITKFKNFLEKIEKITKTKEYKYTHNNKEKNKVYPRIKPHKIRNRENKNKKIKKN